jgi:type I restriction enzyme S subunit
MSDWETAALEDLSIRITKGTTPSKSMGGFSDFGVNYVKSESITHSGIIDASKFQYISIENHEKLKRSQLAQDDILFSMAGVHLGKTAMVKEEYLPANTNQAVCLIRIDPCRAHPKFVFYSLRRAEVKHFALNATSQSAQPNINLKDIGSISVPLPAIEDQKAIAHILGALDDKIELNQKMNQTLEEIAKAIFKSWFVDFDPVRAKAEGRPTGLPPEINDLFPDELVDSEIGEIPKGWEIAPLDEIGNFRNGLALQKYPAKDGEEKLPVVKIAQLRKGSTNGDELFASGVPSDFVITDGDYVFSWSGSLMAKYWVGGKGALNQHLFKVEERTQPLWFIAGWVEHFMPEFQSIAESKATTMGHIKREHLRQAICAIPPEELIKRSTEVLTPLIKRLILSQQEAKILSELRDTLLPKLISGELRIPDAEKFLEEAGL